MVQNHPPTPVRNSKYLTIPPTPLPLRNIKMVPYHTFQHYHKGPFINYVVLVGEAGSPKDNLLHRPYLTKKTTRGEGVKNRPFWDDIVYGRPLNVRQSIATLYDIDSNDILFRKHRNVYIRSDKKTRLIRLCWIWKISSN